MASWIERRFWALPDSIASRIRCRRAAVIHGIDERQRGLALRQVVPDILAELFRLGVVVQGIVDELKRAAEVTAVVGQALLHGLALLREDGAELGAGFEQLGGLAVDDLHVVPLGDVGVIAVHELQDLAFGDGIGRIGENLEHPQFLQLHHHLERAGIEEIADENARLIAEQ